MKKTLGIGCLTLVVIVLFTGCVGALFMSPEGVEDTETNTAEVNTVDATEDNEAPEEEAEEVAEEATEEVTEESTEEAAEESTEEAVTEVTEETEESDVPREWESALSSAETYADMMSMSRQGIYDQLTSEVADNFPEEAAQYAYDNIEWDWNENALETAENYQDLMAMSHNAIYDQLIFEGFTSEEAQYAVDNLE